MIWTELEYICTELECNVQGWNAFYGVGMLPTVLECVLQGWNAFYRVGMLSTEVKYLCTELECFL
jgi:hypothetical protein